MSAPQQYPRNPQQAPQASRGVPNGSPESGGRSAYGPQPASGPKPQFQRDPYAPPQGFTGPGPQPQFNANNAPGFSPQQPLPTFMKRSANGFAIAGLVVSLIATLVVLGRYSDFLSPFGVIGLILSVIGYAVNRNEDGSAASRTARIFALVGGILSSIAILITLFTGIFDPGMASHSLFW